MFLFPTNRTFRWLPPAPRVLLGLIAVAVVAAAALAAEALTPRAGVPAVVFALALGALAGNALPRSARATLGPGLDLVTKKVLKAAIVVLGLRFTAERARDLGGPVLALIAACLVLSLVVAGALGRPFGVSRRAAVLLGCGTAICGATAVVTVAPLLRADDDEVAFSIATIFLFNLAALFALPPIGHALGLSDLAFGAWVGTAVNDTSVVVATGGAFSPAAGDYATAIKLIRTLALVPLAVVVALAASAGARDELAPGRLRLDLRAIFPWFVVGFAGAAVLANVVHLPEEPVRWALLAAQVAITGVLAAVGLNLDARRVVGVGTRSLGLGFAIAGVMAAASLGLASLLGIR